MKKITRLADSVLERLVRPSTASASKLIGWPQCDYDAICARKGRRRKLSCYRRSDGIVMCLDKGCTC